MKILLTFLLLFSLKSFAATDVCIDPTGIPSDYVTGGTEVLTGVSTAASHFQIVNLSDAELCFCWGGGPAGSCIDKMCLPANSSFSRDGQRPGTLIRARHDGGAATTGKLCLGAW